jgi:hypothetical protein
MMPPRCPTCGGSFTIDPTAEVERTIAPPFFVVGRDQLERRRVRRPVAFCNDCEFSVELSVVSRA